MAHKREVEVPATVGSANVFADLGFADSEERLIKADLTIHIKSEIRERGLTEAQVVELGLTRPEASRIGGIKTEVFSLERLLGILRKFSMDIEIRLHHREDGQLGTLKVLETA
jgi:predicted XRE-type DNA-binding protein